MMTEIMFEAAKHDGTSIVEILQNCVIFNATAHEYITSKENRDNMQLHLKHGEKMIFGKEKNKGIRLNDRSLEVVTIGENGISEEDILIHDMHNPDPGIHLMLAKMSSPIAFGVIRAAAAPTYDDLMEEQIAQVKAGSNIKCMDDLFNSGETWEIK